MAKKVQITKEEYEKIIAEENTKVEENKPIDVDYKLLFFVAIGAIVLLLITVIIYYFSFFRSKSYKYMKEKLDFFDEKIVFKIEGKGNYYYSYDCMQEVINGPYTYRAYNIEQAQSMGLKEGSCK